MKQIAFLPVHKRQTTISDLQINTILQNSNGVIFSDEQLKASSEEPRTGNRTERVLVSQQSSGSQNAFDDLMIPSGTELARPRQRTHRSSYVPPTLQNEGLIEQARQDDSQRAPLSDT